MPVALTGIAVVIASVLAIRSVTDGRSPGSCRDATAMSAFEPLTSYLEPALVGEAVGCLEVGKDGELSLVTGQGRLQATRGGTSQVMFRSNDGAEYIRNGAIFIFYPADGGAPLAWDATVVPRPLPRVRP